MPAALPATEEPSLLVITWEVTEHVRAQEALNAGKTRLAAAETRFRQKAVELELIYRSVPVGLAILDPSLRYLRINQQLADIHGLSVQAHIGKTIWEVVPNIADQLASKR
ncbi:PAS domain-containing protein [Thiohalomonas denitrificans]|uniref:PAS fold-containing protein n=1 Tax=Thiohalomonas denitrificans TaxID=415747 RepID=A0A1G5R1B2_9GAMM|nr:PAS domain-containing protein [Thiohalomonas denitrificans]SCZ67580.1 PAS fold-containing protein [Thiohalomonas denitrificans]